MRKLHIALCVLISAAFVALGVFVFSASYVRFWEAITDMGISVAVYFCEIFSIPYTFTATFLQPSSVFGWANNYRFATTDTFINAGTYRVTVTLSDKNYLFSTGSKDNYSFTYTIEAATACSSPPISRMKVEVS